MKTITQKVERIELISSKYEELRKEFISNQEIIVGLLKTLIDKYANSFNLTKANSMRNLRFYSIVHRIKESDSFSEKLIRNNDYNHFNDIVANVEDIDEPSLKAKIKELEDLIGIKILTDLTIDTVNMFNLISSSVFQKEAESKGIKFNPDDLKSQPVVMKNGLTIYKLRCKYEEWKFELQIKSKLESAWGDMEHSIFYKDYKITPVRDLAQDSMRHIGKLLLQVDNFLQDIRDANDNYSLNSKVTQFIYDFESIYSQKISDLLNGVNYNFKKIASLLFNVSQLGINVLDDKDIDVKYLEFTCEKYNSYVISRNNDFDLQIFEVIIQSQISQDITSENLEESLDNFFDTIKRSYEKMIFDNTLIQDEELGSNLIKGFFEICVEYNCVNFILETNNVYRHIHHYKILMESVEVLEFSPAELKQLLTTYTIHIFKGDLARYLNTVDRYGLLDILEKTKLQVEQIDSHEEEILPHVKSIINKIA